MPITRVELIYSPQPSPIHPSAITFFVEFSYKPGFSVHSISDRHRYVLCPCMRDAKVCRFETRTIDTKRYTHICPFLQMRSIKSFTDVVRPRTNDDNPFFFQKKDVELPIYQEDLLQLLLDFHDETGIPYSSLTCKSMKRFITGIANTARENPNVDGEKLLPALNPHTLPKYIQSRYKKHLERLIYYYRGLPVAIMCDAAKINNNNYLVLTITSFVYDSPISFLQLREGPSTKEEYAGCLADIIYELKTNNITVTSICTDGCPAQVSGIDLLLHELEEGKTELKGQLNLPVIPFRLPCLNHRISLATKDCISHLPELQRIVAMLTAFINGANSKDKQALLQKIAPSFVETRWLSLATLSAYVRIKRDVIAAQNFLPVSGILDILRLEILLTPLTELQYFMETDRARICFVYPALLRAFNQYLLIASDPSFSSGVWLSITAEMMTCLYNRIMTNNFGCYYSLSFALTPCGSYLFQMNALHVGFSPDITLAEAISQLFGLY